MNIETLFSVKFSKYLTSKIGKRKPKMLCEKNPQIARYFFLAKTQIIKKYSEKYEFLF